MEGTIWRPTDLTAEQMEERRLTAAVLLRQGRLPQAEIARQVGGSRASVCRWAATLAQEGRHGLAARPNLGPPARLDEKAWTRLSRLLDRGAIAAGFAPNGGRPTASRPCSNAGSGCMIIRAIWHGRSRRTA